MIPDLIPHKTYIVFEPKKGGFHPKIVFFFQVNKIFLFFNRLDKEPVINFLEDKFDEGKIQFKTIFQKEDVSVFP